jgi:hypothetical protein
MRPAHSRNPAGAGRLARPAFQHQVAGRGILARVLAHECVQFHRLASIRARFVEGDAVGQSFEISPVEMNLELIARLMMKPGLYVDAGDIRVDVHDEHGAVCGREHV